MKVDDWHITLIGFGIFIFSIISFFLLVFIQEVIFTPTQDEICQSIGMKSYKYIMDAAYCVDYNYDAYFVDIKCEGWFQDTKCTADIISVGDVRVR